MKNFFKRNPVYKRLNLKALQKTVNNEIIMFQVSLNLAGSKTRSESTRASTKIAFEPQLFLDS